MSKRFGSAAADGQNGAVETPPVVRARRAAATLLSLLAPGAGHLLLGRVGRCCFWQGTLWFGLFASLLTNWGLAMLFLSRIGAAIDIAFVDAHPPLPTWRSGFLLATAVVLLQWPLHRLLRTFYAEGWRVAGPEMAPTLLVSDHILGRKFGLRPERGQIVLFTRPSYPDHDQIERVAALERDLVAIRRGVLYVNGRSVVHVAQPEPCPAEITTHGGAACTIVEESVGEHRYRTAVNPTDASLDFPSTPYDCPEHMPTSEAGDACLVPDGHLFVLGDNRLVVNDSRDWGPIRTSRLKAVPSIIWMSFAGPPGAVNWQRVGVPLR